jgi:hypothetical protein
MNHRNVNHCFPGVSAVLIVFAQASVLPKPAEHPLYNPPLGQNDAVLGCVRTFDDLQGDLAIAAKHCHPGLMDKVELRSLSTEQPLLIAELHARRH